MIKNLGIYIHIPYCERKCNYCSFLSFSPNNQQIDHEEYVDNLIKEIEYRSQWLPEKFIVNSIYIGGGTPSCIDERYIKKIVDKLYEKFTISNDVEVTIEVNPHSVIKSKLQFYYNIGVNRLSIGVQSLHDNELEIMGRLHNRSTALSTIRSAKEACFTNISADIIFGVPEQTKDSLIKTVKELIATGINHISAYSLQIEDNTQFYNDYKYEKYAFHDERFIDEEFYLLSKFLEENGYIQYEISNYSKNNTYSRHNLKYWNYEDFIGFGIGASSFLSGYRYKNDTDIYSWIASINYTKEKNYFNKLKKEDIDDAISIYTFTALRKNEGINLKEFEKMFNVKFWEHYQDKLDFIKEQIENGYLLMDKDVLRLTQEGIIKSNSIMCEFV
ncbi:MAG: radical SAM family heme chaperone HemW [Eubacteriales bacterium]|nr:radical SAM family heme chaperone HemW [Eubacteriales bacterium]MDY3332948.1 radical SAM family heme chaperone HemW [Gallibacter sp.]